MRWTWAFVIALSVLLAGCSGGKDGPGQDDRKNPAASGVIHGKVLDDELRPLHGAVVAVALDNGSAIEDTTTEAGEYRLENLPSGPQRLTATYPNHLPAERSLLVLPGQEKLLDLMLERVGSLLPFDETITFEGQYQCAVASPAHNGSCDPATENIPPPANHSYHLVDKWGGILFEVEWATGSPSATMNAVRFKVGSFGDYGTYIDVEGTDNPVRVGLNRGDTHPGASLDYALPPEGGKVWLSVEPGGTDNQGTMGPGAALDLSYKVYVTVFVNQPLDPEFSAVAGG